MMKKRRGKKRYAGQLPSGRIDPRHAGSLSAVALIEAGLHVRTVADITGLTPSQVMYRYRCCGKSPRDYRDGKGFVAEMVIREVSVTESTKEKDVNRYKDLLGRYQDSLENPG